MALLFAESFDGYSTWGNLVNHASAWDRNADYSSSAGAFGGGCIQSASLAEGDSFPLKVAPSGSTIRVAWWMRCNITSPTTTGNRPVLMLKNKLGTVFFRVMVNGTPRLQISKFDDVATATLTLLSDASPNDDTWHHYEIELMPHLTAGVLKLWVDGVAASGNISSGDTSDAAAGTIADFDLIQVAGCSSNTSGAAGVKIDDVIVWDDSGSGVWTGHLPDRHRIDEVRPTGAGSSTQFTPSTGTNYQCVDEATFDDTDYVESGTVGHIDYYSISGLGRAPSVVMAIVLETWVKNNDIDDRTFRQKLLSGASIGNGATTLLKGQTKRLQEFYAADPNTSAVWNAGNAQSIPGWGYEVVA